jgi:hypothetical protein
MDFVRVVEVVDGNTVAVSPSWKYEGVKGQLVRINGLGIPKGGEVKQEIARCKLMFLVSSSVIGITRIHGRADDVLVCDVEYSGRNITEHMYEYAVTDEAPNVNPIPDSPSAVMLNLAGT